MMIDPQKFISDREIPIKEHYLKVTTLSDNNW